MNVELLSLLNAISKFPHVLIKRMGDDYSNLPVNSDLDFFVMDIESILPSLVKTIQPFITESCTFQIHEVKPGKHFHFDILKDGKLQFRIDLYGSLPDFTKVSVKQGLFESVIDRSESKLITVGGQNVSLKVPAHVDEAILRYLEFQEWYANRPDKIKHAEWIENHLNAPEQRSEFFLRLHHFTKITSYSLEKPEIVRSKAGCLEQWKQTLKHNIKKS